MWVAVVPLLPITLIILLATFPVSESPQFTEALSWVEGQPTLLSNPLFHLAKVLVLLFTYRVSALSYLGKIVIHNFPQKKATNNTNSIIVFIMQNRETTLSPINWTIYSFAFYFSPCKSNILLSSGREFSGTMMSSDYIFVHDTQVGAH